MNIDVAGQEKRAYVRVCSTFIDYSGSNNLKAAIHGPGFRWRAWQVLHSSTRMQSNWEFLQDVVSVRCSMDYCPTVAARERFVS